MAIELRPGRWEDVMGDVTCDALITDPPYSDRTHEGQRSAGHSDEWGSVRRALDYESIGPDYARAFVTAWAPRVRGWWVVFGDHDSSKWWAEALRDAGLYAFPPVVWVKTDATPRFSGDGPASQVEYLSVARPREAQYMGWGSLPGWYIASRSGRNVVPDSSSFGMVGTKPIDLMRALIRDYTRPGWTIADPHAGSGTTLIAARLEGRSCIGAERDPDTYAIARRRLGEGWTPDLFTSDVGRAK